MTCVILRPDPQTMFDRIKTQFENAVLGGGLVVPESNEWYVVTNDYAAAEQFYAIADQMWRESNPATACCDNLYALAARNGVFPYPAKAAQGYVILTGQPGTSIPSSFEVQTDGGTYTSVGTIPLTMPNEGSIIVRVIALIPGAAGNANTPGMTGVLTTTVTNIDTVVNVCGGLFCGGADAETCEQFRQRYLARLAYQPKATQAWIKSKLLEWPCATRVCVREGNCCACGDCTPNCDECGCAACGTRLEFYVMFDDSFPCGIPPPNVVFDINTWMFGERQGYGEGEVEIGVCGQIFTPIPIQIDINIDIEGCPTTAQKQEINNLIIALFRRICPSILLRNKQVELIIASVIGAEVNAQALFALVDPADAAHCDFVDGCELDPHCDYIPCLRNINYTPPQSVHPC